MGPPPTVGPPTEVTGRVRIAAECMRLESARRETVRGFESHTLRRMFVMFGRRQAEGGDRTHGAHGVASRRAAAGRERRSTMCRLCGWIGLEPGERADGRGPAGRPPVRGGGAVCDERRCRGAAWALLVAGVTLAVAPARRRPGTSSRPPPRTPVTVAFLGLRRPARDHVPAARSASAGALPACGQHQRVRTVRTWRERWRKRSHQVDGRSSLERLPGQSPCLAGLLVLGEGQASVLLLFPDLDVHACRRASGSALLP